MILKIRVGKELVEIATFYISKYSRKSLYKSRNMTIECVRI